MSRPQFSLAWAAARRIYDPANSGEHVAKMIGGAVAKNIHMPAEKGGWTNTCAVRMSYILNETGTRLPAIVKKTVTGADKRNYFFRVDELISYLPTLWGKPQVISYPPSGAMAGKKGLVMFEVVGWSNARGHATLYNGSACYDHCYFYEKEAAYKTTKAHFWALQ